MKRRVDARLEGRGTTQSPAEDAICQTTFAVPRRGVSAFGLSQMLRDTKAGLPPTRKNTKAACCGITTSSRLVIRAGTVRVGSCPAKAGFVSDDATTPEGFGKSAAAGEAKPQARARRSCRISSQDDTAHRRLSWSRVSASNGERGMGNGEWRNRPQGKQWNHKSAQIYTNQETSLSHFATQDLC